MADYTVQYRALPFEAIQIRYRRKLVLREIGRHAPQRLLEVGCGDLPLFTDLPHDVECTVVEPVPEFADKARRLAGGRQRTRVLQCLVEDLVPDEFRYDMVILSCVLHEARDPMAMLSAVRGLCGPETLLHVNVPNARSLHRLLAVAMGLIPDPGVQSDTQRLMQQRARTYDATSLENELTQAGFNVLDQGSLFVKPFTHAQMQHLVDASFMTPAMLDGLDELVTLLPELGSEVWANARRTR